MVDRAGASPRLLRRRRRIRPAPLRLAPELALPLRQEIPLEARPWAEIVGPLRSVLDGAGYDLVSVAEPDLGPAGAPGRRPLEVVAERDPVGAPMSPTGRLSVYTLLGAGIGLGIFDALAVGAPWVAGPWAAGAIAVTILFWYRYGRGYESDVVVAVYRPDGRMIWFGGRVRSDVRAGDRIGYAAVPLPRLGREMGALTRAVAERLRTPVG